MKAGNTGNGAGKKGVPHHSRIYSDLSGVYDHVFMPIFARRIESVVAGLDIQSNARVLEVGVGTGLSLDAYPPHCRVTAIDLSTEMLARAEAKRDPWQHRHIELRQMDALALEFEDGAFDFVTAFHTVTVVPDPRKLVAEMARVCKPGGQIVIINHFSSERPVIRAFVDLADPLTRVLGWSTRLRLGDVLQGSGLDLEQRYKTSPFSLFTIVEARKFQPPGAATQLRGTDQARAS